MATRRVVVEGEEVLRKHAKSAGPVTPHLKEILQDMVETMREENGVGLAAPQVGIMRRMFVAQSRSSLSRIEVTRLAENGMCLSV